MPVTAEKDSAQAASRARRGAASARQPQQQARPQERDQPAVEVPPVAHHHGQADVGGGEHRHRERRRRTDGPRGAAFQAKQSSSRAGTTVMLPQRVSAPETSVHRWAQISHGLRYENVPAAVVVACSALTRCCRAASDSRPAGASGNSSASAAQPRRARSGGRRVQRDQRADDRERKRVRVPDHARERGDARPRATVGRRRCDRGPRAGSATARTRTRSSGSPSDQEEAVDQRPAEQRRDQQVAPPRKVGARTAAARAR